MRLRFSNLFSMIALSILGVHPESSARSPQQLSVANCAATFGLPTIKTQTSENIDKAFKIKPFITGWFQPTPLKNMKVSWDDYSQYICSKPPSYYIYKYMYMYIACYIPTISIRDRMRTAGARIIERSQEYKSTVKYRTFVLLRVPIPRGVGKFNYRTGPGKH